MVLWSKLWYHFTIWSNLTLEASLRYHHEIAPLRFFWQQIIKKCSLRAQRTESICMLSVLLSCFWSKSGKLLTICFWLFSINILRDVFLQNYKTTQTETQKSKERDCGCNCPSQLCIYIETNAITETIEPHNKSIETNSTNIEQERLFKCLKDCQNTESNSKYKKTKNISYVTPYIS